MAMFAVDEDDFNDDRKAEEPSFNDDRTFELTFRKVVERVRKLSTALLGRLR